MDYAERQKGMPGEVERQEKSDEVPGMMTAQTASTAVLGIRSEMDEGFIR
jgi:hypothetical protein